ncbi:MAG: hypothetical protein J0L84_12970, partial [Verrucomicrobia bacterium]|nr:hypothetical protein [Verrucomicrobiota bacterium]
MNNSGLTDTQVGQVLSGEQFLRERLQPRCGDPNFLCLSDLLGVIRPFAAAVPAGGRVFYYGCGRPP